MNFNLNEIVKVGGYSVKLRLIEPAHNRPHESDPTEQTHSHFMGIPTMKISTLILAGLMTLTSAAAFAEGGSERSRKFYANFNFMQKQAQEKAEQTASSDVKHLKADDTQQPKS